MPRALRQHPWFVVFGVTCLAFTVGANLVVFTVVNALWLRPLPFPAANRLVMLLGEGAGANESMTFSGVESADQWLAFEAVAGQVTTSGQLASLATHLVLDDIGEEVETLAVTSGYFGLFGQRVRGRDFTPGDNRTGSEPVAILSDDLWRRAFGRRSDVVGAVVTARPFAIRVIGIAPAGFQGARRGERADIWIPSQLVPRLAPLSGMPASSEDILPTMVFARLRPWQTPQDAKQRLLEAAAGSRDRRVKERVHIVPLAQVFGTPQTGSIVIGEQRTAVVVAALAALVLVAGCTTLMALVLVHYERRRRELSLRTALGATRLRLIGDLGRELTWLGAGGAAGAMLISVWSLRSLPALTLPGGVDLTRVDLSLDWRVVTACLGLTLLTLVAAAFLPCRQFTRADISSELIGANSTPSTRSERTRKALLSLHVLATVVVLVAAGLFIRSVIYGFTDGPGFDIDRTVYARVQVVSPFENAETDIEARDRDMLARTQRLREGLYSLPGVESVALGPAPIGEEQTNLLLTPKVVESGTFRREMRVGVLSGSPDLAQALGLRLVKGRTLSDSDAGAMPRPAVVTTSLARMWSETEEPLGQRVSLGFRQGSYVVVGVIEDFSYGSLTQASAGVVVTVQGRGFGMEPPFIIRAERPELLVEPIRRLIRDVVPDAPRVVISTGRELIARDMGRQRLGAVFFSGFGVVALVLGVGSVFGLVACLAETRRREFGVRFALGATPKALVWQGISEASKPVAAGVAGGLMVAALVSRGFASMLPGLSPDDPLTHLAVASLIIVSSMSAALCGAWRIRRLPPGEALRMD